MIVLYIIAFLDNCGFSAVVPWLGPRIQQLGASPVVDGLIGSAFGALQFLTGPLMGSCSDSYGRKSTLLVCMLVTGISYALLGAAQSIEFVLFARIVAGVFKHSQTLLRASILDRVNRDSTSALGRLRTATGFGLMIGPLIGSWIIRRQQQQHNDNDVIARKDDQLNDSTTTGDGFFYICLVAVLMFAASIGFIMGDYLLMQIKRLWRRFRGTTKVKSQTKSPHKASKNGYHQLQHPPSEGDQQPVNRSSVVWFVSKLFPTSLPLRDLFDVLLLAFLFNLVVCIHRTQFSLLLIQADEFRFDKSTVGLLISFQGGVTIVSGLLLGAVSGRYLPVASALSRSLPKSVLIRCYWRQLAHGTALLCASFLLRLRHPLLGRWLLMASVVPQGFACVWLFAVANQLAVLKAPVDRRGAVLGLTASVVALARTVAPVTAGLAVDRYGLYAAESLSVALLFVTLFVAMLRLWACSRTAVVKLKKA